MTLSPQQLLDRANDRADARSQAHVPIDYEAANRSFRKQKVALTRAVNSGDKKKVIAAAKSAVDDWDRPEIGWPDDWSRWQRALDDVLGFGHTILLEDLRDRRCTRSFPIGRTPRHAPWSTTWSARP